MQQYERRTLRVRLVATGLAVCVAAAVAGGGVAWAGGGEHDEGKKKKPRPPKLSQRLMQDASEEAIEDHFSADEVTFEKWKCKRRTRSRGWCRATFSADGEQYRAKTRVRSFWNEDDERDAEADVLWARAVNPEPEGPVGGEEPPQPGSDTGK